MKDVQRLKIVIGDKNGRFFFHTGLLPAGIVAKWPLLVNRRS
jgi:hypothetical protein